MRLELTQPNGHYPLKVARLPIPPPGHFYQKIEFGAKNGTRTRDPDLGKVVLYQLSYFRIFLSFASGTALVSLICDAKLRLFSGIRKFFCHKFSTLF